MIVEKIIEQFKKTASRVLFLFDEEREYEEELLSYQGDDFKCLVVTDNYFTIKYEVEIINKDEQILLYHNCSVSSIEKNLAYPLLDLFLVNREIRIDHSAEFLLKYNLEGKFAHVLLKHKNYLVDKKEEKLLPFLANTSVKFDEVRFENAVLSLIIGSDEIGDKKFNLIQCFIEMLKGEKHWTSKIKKIEKQNLVEVFISSVLEVTTVKIVNIEYSELKRLLSILKYNAITSKIENREDQYSGSLKIEDKGSLAIIDGFFRTWSNAKKYSKLEDVLVVLGEQVKEDYLIKFYGANQEYGLMTKRFKELSVQKFYDMVLDNPNDFYDEYKNWNNQNSEYEGAEKEMLFLVNAAGFLKRIKSYVDFDFNYLKDYLVKYQAELYELDLMYRHAYTAYQEIGDESKVKSCNNLYNTLNKAYDQYLIDLNVAWIKILDAKDFDFNSIDFKKQYNFYNDFIANSDSKRVVIISDAFRYELGMDLKHELNADTKNSIELEAMLASVPSYTNLGMSNLLPNNGIETVHGENSIDYSIDGIKTISSNREKILKLYNENSCVVDYSTFSNLSVDEQRIILKGKGVVYIYHNWMDAIGDSKVSEHHTFQSAESCMKQLSTLIRRLYTSLNTYNIIVTADHGFLFNVQDIAENSRQEFPILEGILKEHTRFCITDGDAGKKEVYSFPLKNTTNIKSDEQVIIPKAINRFRKKGNFGVQFVHGGCSLQEIIVPVFNLSRKKDKTVSNVDFTFFKESITVTSYEFKLDILQSEEVGERFNASELIFGVYDKDNNLISQEESVLLNSTSKSPSDRVFSIIVKLTEDLSNIRTGFIIVYSKQDRLNPLKKLPIKISILTEKDDF